MIRTALTSFGMSGKLFHAPFIDAHPDFYLVGAWERSQKNIQAIYPHTQSFSSYDEISCYAKDAARQLLTVYRDKKIILADSYLEVTHITTVEQVSIFAQWIESINSNPQLVEIRFSIDNKNNQY